MGERCYFGLEYEDGTVDAVYIHWCANPKDAAKDLRRGGYVDRQGAEALIKRGGARQIYFTSHEDQAYDDMPTIRFASANAYRKNFAGDVCFNQLYLFRDGAWRFVDPKKDSPYRLVGDWETLLLDVNTKPVAVDVQYLTARRIEINVPSDATNEDVFQKIREMFYEDDRESFYPKDADASLREITIDDVNFKKSENCSFLSQTTVEWRRDWR